MNPPQGNEFYNSPNRFFRTNDAAWGAILRERSLIRCFPISDTAVSLCERLFDSAIGGVYGQTTVLLVTVFILVARYKKIQKWISTKI